MVNTPGLNSWQVRLYVVRPALEYIGLWSRDAEELVLATAAQESRFQHLRQLNDGPARGLWQMEPATMQDVVGRYLPLKPKLERAVHGLLAGAGTLAEQLGWNLAFGAALCRVRYLYDPHPLPHFTDVLAMAQTWKRVYNAGGRGTVEEFIESYRLLVEKSARNAVA